MSEISEQSVKNLKSVSYNVGDDIGTKVDLNQTIDILIRVYIKEHNRQLRADGAGGSRVCGEEEVS